MGLCSILTALVRHLRRTLIDDDKIKNDDDDDDMSNVAERMSVSDTKSTEEMIQIVRYKKTKSKRLYSDSSFVMDTIALKKGNAFIDDSFHPKMQYLDKPNKGIFDLMDIQTITTLDLNESDSDDTMLERPQCHAYSAMSTACTEGSSVATTTMMMAKSQKRNKLQIAINKQIKYANDGDDMSDEYNSETSQESVSESSIIAEHHIAAKKKKERHNAIFNLDVDELRNKLMKVLYEDDRKNSERDSLRQRKYDHN